MRIFDGAVVVWTEAGGAVFNDVSKADTYFQEANTAGFNPQWGRIFKEQTMNKENAEMKI